MKYLTDTSILSEMCKSSKKWGLFFRISCPEALLEMSEKEMIEEICQAAPFLSDIENAQLLADSSGYAVADTEEEINTLFETFVGDDGPTKSNPYTGPATVYALTCGPDGEFRRENT